MLRGMEFAGHEGKTVVEIKVNNCPVCGVNGVIGGFCQTHLNAIKDYQWVRDYVNSLEHFDRKTVNILEAAISDRISYVINDIPVKNGRLQIEEYLVKKLSNGNRAKCSLWMEKILKEILSLQKAKNEVIKIIDKDQVMVGGDV